jgi:hypothetical protein
VGRASDFSLIPYMGMSYMRRRNVRPRCKVWWASEGSSRAGDVLENIRRAISFSGEGSPQQHERADE